MPINCLNSIYKIFAKALETKIRQHVEPLLEQRGCSKDISGTQESLLIDRIFTEITAEQKGSMSTTWIDMTKALDSLSHDWIFDSLQALKVSTNIINTVKRLMGSWNTILSHNGREISEPSKYDAEYTKETLCRHFCS
jgi:hypothetical protein